jgi:molybdopterin converting factor small subunit
LLGASLAEIPCLRAQLQDPGQENDEMGVKVSVPVFLQAFTGDQETIEVEGKTVGDCLQALSQMHPDIRKMLVNDRGILHSYVGIYINAEDAFPNELAKPVKDGDEIHILYALAGG